ncbi:MAG: pyridoxamine 5'-phosphate oxidase family protein [bacterium]|nr:pyridoxamine 5'-phosphate oxidase family protein [bacterium]
MEELKKLVKEILDQAYIMSLATVDESGPWVSDLVFVYDDDFTIYWLALPNTRRSQAILKNPKVAASITVSNNQGEDNVGLQLEGIAEKIEGDILEIATKHLNKRKKPAPTKEGEIFEGNQCWYKLKPSKI